jgi:hypothetical protein
MSGQVLAPTQSQLRSENEKERSIPELQWIHVHHNGSLASWMDARNKWVKTCGQIDLSVSRFFTNYWTVV